MLRNLPSVMTPLFGFSLLSLAGCGSRPPGPPLANVSGVVTLDGQPLSEASILFEPVGKGRPSLGVTDGAGRYQLEFTPGTAGALPGKHLVQISTWQEGYDNGTVHPAKPERVPESYNRKAATTPEMLRDVAGEGTTIDFALVSKAGKVVQPADPRSKGR